MGKTKTRKFRGSGRHGRGRKAGRGKGLRGGKGNAGLHKHKYATTVIKEAQGIEMFGHKGFKRPSGASLYDVAINVGDLPQRFPGQSALNLGDHGFTKLLGAGDVSSAITITVEAASAGAVSKIQKAGGKVQVTRAKKQPKPKKAAMPPPAAAPPAKKESAKPPAAKPAAAKPPAPKANPPTKP